MVADRGHGRFTVPASHEAAYRAMPATLEVIERDRLADRVAVYARGGVQLTRIPLKGGQWSRSPGAREAVEAERVRPWSPGERQDYAAGWGSRRRANDGPGRAAEDLHHARSVRAATYLRRMLRRFVARRRRNMLNWSATRGRSLSAGIAVVMQDGARRSSDYRLELVRLDRAMAERVGVTIREAEANQSYRGRLADGVTARCCGRAMIGLRKLSS